MGILSDKPFVSPSRTYVAICVGHGRSGDTVAANPSFRSFTIPEGDTFEHPWKITLVDNGARMKPLVLDVRNDSTWAAWYLLNILDSFVAIGDVIPIESYQDFKPHFSQVSNTTEAR